MILNLQFVRELECVVSECVLCIDAAVRYVLTVAAWRTGAVDARRPRSPAQGAADVLAHVLGIKPAQHEPSPGPQQQATGNTTSGFQWGTTFPIFPTCPNFFILAPYYSPCCFKSPTFPTFFQIKLYLI